MKIQKSDSSFSDQSQLGFFARSVGRLASYCVRNLPVVGTVYGLTEFFRANAVAAQSIDDAPVIWNTTLPVEPMGNSSLAQTLLLKGVLITGNNVEQAKVCISTVQMSLFEYAQAFGACVNNSANIALSGGFDILTFTRSNGQPVLGMLVDAANNALPYAFFECRKVMLQANVTGTLSNAWNSCMEQFDTDLTGLWIAIPVLSAVGVSAYVYYRKSNNNETPYEPDNNKGLLVEEDEDSGAGVGGDEEEVIDIEMEEDQQQPQNEDHSNH